MTPNVAGSSALALAPGRLRDRTDARAARRARRPAGGAARRPRRGDERQVDGDAHDRGSCCSPRGCGPARISRPTCARGASGSGSRGARSTWSGAGRRPAAAERLGATQFETITAAAFVAFARRGVDVAVVEAGLGGRHDATNVLARARRRAHERRARAHRRARRRRRGDRGREARCCPCRRHGCPRRAGLRTRRGSRRRRGRDRRGRRPELAPKPRAFVGHASTARRWPYRSRAGSSAAAREVRDGAHNPDGVRWLAAHLRPDDYTVWRRSSPTRTWTRCSRGSPPSGDGSSRPHRRTHARSRRRSSPAEPGPTSTWSRR